MSVKIEPVQSEPVTGGPIICHIVCCLDDDSNGLAEPTLCGFPLDDEHWYVEGVDQTCVVCDEIEATHPFRCPRGGECIG